MADDPETGCPDPAKALPNAPPGGCIPCAAKAAANTDAVVGMSGSGGKLVYADKAVEVRTGVQLKQEGVNIPDYPDAIAIKVKCCKSPHVVQFVNRQVLDATGKPKKLMITTTGGTYAMTEDLHNPVWNTDSASKPNPYYEGGGAHRTQKCSLTIFDQPRVESPTGPLQLGKDESSYVRFHSYIICNGKVIRLVEWTRSGKQGGKPSYAVHVYNRSSLPESAKDVLKNQGFNNAL